VPAARLRPQPHAHARPLREPATKPNTPMPITGSAMPPLSRPRCPRPHDRRRWPRPSADLAPTRGDRRRHPGRRRAFTRARPATEGRRCARPHTREADPPGRHRHRPTGCPLDATGCPRMAGRPSKAIGTPLYHYRPGDGESGLAGAHAPAHAPTPAQTHTRRQADARTRPPARARKNPPQTVVCGGLCKPLVRFAP
jgi:hypothetical protein